MGGAPPFSINVDPTRALLFCAGELDLAADPELEAALLLLEADASEVARVVRIDVSRVTLISCCCLRVLDGSRRRLEADGRRLDVVAASPAFVQVADLARYRQLARMAERAPKPADPLVRWRHLPHRLPAAVAGWLGHR